MKHTVLKESSLKKMVTSKDKIQPNNHDDTEEAVTLPKNTQHDLYDNASVVDVLAP